MTAKSLELGDVTDSLSELIHRYLSTTCDEAGDVLADVNNHVIFKSVFDKKSGKVICVYMQIFDSLINTVSDRVGKLGLQVSRKEEYKKVIDTCITECTEQYESLVRVTTGEEKKKYLEQLRLHNEKTPPATTCADIFHYRSTSKGQPIYQSLTGHEIDDRQRLLKNTVVETAHRLLNNVVETSNNFATEGVCEPKLPLWRKSNRRKRPTSAEQESDDAAKIRRAREQKQFQEFIKRHEAEKAKLEL
jgi:hypothetical protein